MKGLCAIRPESPCTAADLKARVFRMVIPSGEVETQRAIVHAPHPHARFRMVIPSGEVETYGLMLMMSAWQPFRMVIPSGEVETSCSWWRCHRQCSVPDGDPIRGS